MQNEFIYRIWRCEDLAFLDQPVFHLDSEKDLYEKREEKLTQLSNLSVKRLICEILNLDLDLDHARQIEVLRQNLKDYGFGKPELFLHGEIKEKWLSRFGKIPAVSLSHHGENIACLIASCAADPIQKPFSSELIGMDLFSRESVRRLWEQGAISLYMTDAERDLVKRIPSVERQIDLLLGGWCVKEAVFKAIGSPLLRGAINRMPYIQVRPEQKIEGRWRVEILKTDEPLRGEKHWYPRLYELMQQEKISLGEIEAYYQNLDEQYGFAWVRMGREI